ncbi:Protein POLAR LOCALIZATION DURING ASYMMETRIC DIVISION AND REDISTRIBUTION [Linum grandiflorum]
MAITTIITPPLHHPNLSVPNNSSSSPAAAAASHRPLRISDILASSHDEDDQPEEEPFFIRRRSVGMGEGNFLEGRHHRNSSSSSYHCSSPCRVVSRWLSWMKRAKTKRISAKSSRIEVVGSSRAEAEECKDSAAVVMQPRCSMKGLNDGSSDENVFAFFAIMSASSGDSISSRQEVSFNTGIGCYLLYLVAATRNELDRINAARLEMETLLQNTKRHRRSADRDDDVDDILFDFSAGKAKEHHELEPQVSTELHMNNSYALPASSDSQDSVNCEVAKREECMEDMKKHLEVELEAELQLLQVQLDRDKLMERSQLLRVRNEDDCSTSSRTYSMISSSSEEGEVIVFPEQGEEEGQSGFSPYELERRLHQVLESRQEEEIRELEAALESMKQKLEVKEMEVAWWKAAAARSGGLHLSSQTHRGGQATETEIASSSSGLVTEQSWCKQ